MSGTKNYISVSENQTTHITYCEVYYSGTLTYTNFRNTTVPLVKYRLKTVYRDELLPNYCCCMVSISYYLDLTVFLSVLAQPTVSSK